MSEIRGLVPALDADDVAELLRMRQQHPRHRREAVRRLYRSGHLPAPIDPTLSASLWRWSPDAIASYIAGDWKGPSPISPN